VNGPLVSELASEAPGCSVSGRLNEPVEVLGFVSGVHVTDTVPVAASGRLCPDPPPKASIESPASGGNYDSLSASL
jgi:hypothetical protein